MTIHLVQTDTEICSCYPVMQILRPHLTAEQFLPRVRQQQQTGYQLAYLRQGDEIVAVAGFRVGENLAWSRYLYVEDLVTAPAQRSRGYGAALLAWVQEYGAGLGCQQIHLDSGLQRTDAHRFYDREGFQRTGYHFAREIAPAEPESMDAP